MKMESLEDVLKMVCEAAGISVEDARGRSRRSDVILARQFYCMIAGALQLGTTAAIGAFIHRDHSTVIASVKRLQELGEVEDSRVMRLAQKIMRA
jgi:chromosomal replication initiator protein